MNTLLTKNTIHRELLRTALGESALSEEEALLWMILFHTHQIRLRPAVSFADLEPSAEGTLVCAVSQRHAAEVIAGCWPEAERRRTDYTYWYFQYNSRTPYECWEDVPAALQPRLLELRETVNRDPRVATIGPEE